MKKMNTQRSGFSENKKGQSPLDGEGRRNERCGRI
jgi:hypothetical protein